MQLFGDMPPNPDYPIPEEAKDRVLNAHLISDSFPGSDKTPTKGNSNVSIAITINNPEKTKEVFNKLKQGGTVTIPLQETFWSPAYGQVRDKFGVTWQVSTEVEEEK